MGESGITEKSREYPCRPAPHDAVPIRPPRRAVAATGSSASGAALPHANPVLLAARRAVRSLSELAAGSAEQLHRASHVSQKGRRVLRRGGSGGRNGRLQPFRLLARAACRMLSVHL